MTYEIRAIFENGILRPLDPLGLAENDVVRVVVQTGADQKESSDLVRQREALQKMFAEADSLPNENPGGTFSGADHDLVLYGWQK